MARQRRSSRDLRRRSYGQNLLTDRRVVQRAIDRLDLQPGQTVLDIGAGRGALTLPLARTGVNVIAVERDRHMVGDLRRALISSDFPGRVEIRHGDFRDLDLPDGPYRVVSSPPFGLTTALLSRLLDEPDSGPERADLLLQWEVARKHAAEPARSLRAAAWAPWWSFHLGERVHRSAFRPVPVVDSAWLVIRRRHPPVLPTWLAPGFADLLRPHWGRRRRGAVHLGCA